MLMREFLRENGNRVLLLLLLGLLFLLWARLVGREVKKNDATRDLATLRARIECAEHYGWEADPGSELKEKVRIPESFSEVYMKYNELQKMCGFDLSNYRGETVWRYTYIVRNYPYELSEPLYINLYIHKDKLIGGDVMTRSVGGFMLPLYCHHTP